MMKKIANVFIKAQLASLIATIVDFCITILLKEVGGLWYLFSTAAGSILGGIINFILGRRWVFKAVALSPGSQAFRYFLVWVCSILLNIGGVFILTNFWHFNYLFSKVITSVIIGIFFNFFLQKKYVFSHTSWNPGN